MAWRNPPAGPGLSRSAESADDEAASGGLSARLKGHTRDDHRRAERAGVVRQILERRVSRQAYAVYLRNLHPVYATLEQRLAPWRGHPTLGALADPGLCRTAALDGDLARLAGSGWRRDLPAIAAGRDYAQRVAAAGWPQLVAHAYVRYLGDLNGGRVLRRLIVESLALPGDALAFYDFSGLPAGEAFPSAFRAALDAAVAAAEVPLVLAEAREAFAHNVALAEAVAVEAGRQMPATPQPG